MNNYLRGRIAQQSGEFFENIIKAKCREYLEKGIANIQKLPVEKKLCRGKLIYAERSTVDFLGFSFVDGKHIAIEAKNVSNGNSFHLDKLQPHQVAYLSHVNQASGLGLLIIGFIDTNEILIIKVDKVFLNFLHERVTIKKGKPIYSKTLSIKIIKGIENLKYKICSFSDFDFLEF